MARITMIDLVQVPVPCDMQIRIGCGYRGDTDRAHGCHDDDSQHKGKALLLAYKAPYLAKQGKCYVILILHLNIILYLN